MPRNIRVLFAIVSNILCRWHVDTSVSHVSSQQDGGGSSAAGDAEFEDLLLINIEKRLNIEIHLFRPQEVEILRLLGSKVGRNVAKGPKNLSCFRRSASSRTKMGYA